MAKTLHERQRSALSQSARLADCRAVLDDTRAESVRLLSEAAAASARAVNPDVASGEARTSRALHLDLIHQSEREDAIADRLALKVSALEADEVTAGRRRAYDAALAERDSLTADLARDYPKAAATIVGLLTRLKASNAAVEAANRNLPKGKSLIGCAEAEARGVPSMSYTMASGHPATLLGMRLPAPGGAGVCWPCAAPAAAISASPSFGEMVAAAKAAEPPKWQRVRVAAHTGSMITFDHRPDGAERPVTRGICNGEWTGWVPIPEAARLERMGGVTVERMETA